MTPKPFKTHVVPVMHLKGKPKSEENITLSTAYCTCGSDTTLAPHHKTLAWAREHSKQHKDMT